jgi:Ca2+-dependent lipid-binding protein
MDTIGTADAYVTLHCPGDHRHLRSKTIKNTLNPEWKEEFTFEIGEGMYDVEMLLKV